MAARKRDACDVWIFDGEGEMEGCLLHLEDGAFRAHVRPVGRGQSTLGRSIPAAPLDLQRHFVSKRLLAHVQNLAGPTLLEFRIESVQRSDQPGFHHLLCGRYRTLEPEELELLAQLPPAAAAALFRRDVS